MTIEKAMPRGANISWLEKPTMSAKVGNVTIPRVVNNTPSGLSYIFLPWNSSGVSQVNSAGVDVISGPFSGCIMGAYHVRGGERYVCHVNKGGANDCSEFWEALKGSDPNSIEFNPFSSISNDALREAGGLVPGVVPNCFGIITATNQRFVVLELKGHVLQAIAL
jgi:hypothetical protein